MNWWNELLEEQGWFDELRDKIERNILDNKQFGSGKIEGYEAKNYDTGCHICGTVFGKHGFSFDTGKSG